MQHSGGPSLLAVAVSPLTGRSYRATCDLPQDSCVLDISTPYADTVYKKFRKEVCAECWRYELGRTDFLTCRDYAEAGLWFCDARCRDSWLEREGQGTVELLKTLEAARIRKEKGKAREDASTAIKQITQDFLDQAWEEVSAQEKRPKTLNKWKMLQLDDFEADLARYVLLALNHLHRESSSFTVSSNDGPSQFAETRPGLNFGAATWNDFASLQSGELLQISKFPELLDNWVHIYQVLKARFASKILRPSAKELSTSASPANTTDLSDVITPQNVRTALGVDPSNSFGIWQVPVTEESEGLGFGIYPVPSFFNHHCAPNVRKERVGRRLRFVTTAAVRAGDELCISYGHVEHMTLAARREHLRDGWFFVCACSRCAEEEASATTRDAAGP